MRERDGATVVKAQQDPADLYWDRLADGIMRYGSREERRTVLSIIQCAAHDELRHPGEWLPGTIGHGRMKRLPKALRRN